MTTEDYRQGTYWEAEGLLWKRVIVWLDGKNVKVYFRDAVNFMQDQELDYGSIDFAEAIEKAMTHDSDFYDQVTMYAEEG
jgi:hypothetical protein